MTTTSAKRTTTAIVRWSDLSIRVQQAAKMGATAAGYEDEDRFLWAVVLSARSRGLDYAALSNGFRHGNIWCAALTRPSVSGGWPRVERLLQKLWDRAGLRLAQRAPQQAVLDMSEALAQLPVLRLPGRGGPAERAVLLVVLEAGRRQGRHTPRVSGVELAVGTGLAESSIDQALRRLKAAGWLEVADQGDCGRRNAWAVDHARITRGGSVVHLGERTSLPGLCALPPSRDLFVQKGLPLWEVCSALTVISSVTSADIAKVLGRDRRTVATHLHTLNGLGLAQATEDGNWVCTASADSVEHAAVLEGCLGASVRHEINIETRDASRRQWLHQREDAVRKYENSKLNKMPHSGQPPTSPMPVLQETELVPADTDTHEQLKQPAPRDVAWAAAIEAEEALQYEIAHFS